MDPVISFNLIPINLLTPGAYVEFDNSRAVQGLVREPFKLLVIGQKLAAGSAAADVPVKIVRADEAIPAFGRGSMLAGMFAVLKAANRTTETWALPLADAGAGVQASGTLTFGGPATGAGTVALMIAGRRINVGVAAGDTATAIAAAAVTAINADLDLPATAASALGVVTVTARHKGAAGNDIDLRHSYYFGEQLPAGVTLAIVAMAGGVTNPDMTAAIAALGDIKYHHVVMPYTDAANLTLLEDELDDRWGPLRQIEGQAWSAARGSHGQLTALAGSRNSPFVSIQSLGASPTPPWIAAAVYGAVAAFHLEIDPARPLQTLPLRTVQQPAEPVQFNREERQLLLQDGAGTLLMLAGGQVAIERAVTTYKTNAFGMDDPSYRDAETIATLALLRYTLRARILQRYPRHKLADDGTNYGPGQAIVTPSIVRAEIVALFLEWEQAGLVEGYEQFKTELLVARNPDDPNRVDALLPPDIVNQLRVFAAQIQFRL